MDTVEIPDRDSAAQDVAGETIQGAKDLHEFGEVFGERTIITTDGLGVTCASRNETAARDWAAVD
jgi:hypothetical protein